MCKRWMCLMVMGIILSLSNGALAYNTSTSPVFTSMLVSDMEQLLASRASTGLRYESGSIPLSGEFVHYIMIYYQSDVASLLFLDDTQVSLTDPFGARNSATAYEGLQMYAFVRSSGGVFDYAEINEWNKQYRGSRAYVDADGDAVLEADLYLSGGVTSETIISFVERYFTALVVFRGFLD